ncbi:ATP-binding protein [Paenibacillus sedimenti]|uniref:histidine kinase n=1 Tax=Paenibacillus sedimenti TaxID=2770274 RepID=A0A926KSQ7_9BACL|nr:ATP-binding protein [Paenibacillus sedimenti]
MVSKGRMYLLSEPILLIDDEEGILMMLESLLRKEGYTYQDSPTLPRSGLGLSIAKQLIQAHGGELAIRSQPRKGTIITIRLPTDPS